MEEINKLIETTKEVYPELEFDLEAIKMAFQDDIDLGYDEEHVYELMKIDIANLVKTHKV